MVIESLTFHDGGRYHIETIFNVAMFTILEEFYILILILETEIFYCYKNLNQHSTHI